MKASYSSLPNVLLIGDSHAEVLKAGFQTLNETRFEVEGGKVAGGAFLNEAHIDFDKQNRLVVTATDGRSLVLPDLPTLREMVVFSTLGFNTHHFVRTNFTKKQHLSRDFLKSVVLEQRRSALQFYQVLVDNQVRFAFVRSPTYPFFEYRDEYRSFENLLSEQLREIGGHEVKMDLLCYDPSTGLLQQQYIARDAIHGTEKYAHVIWKNLISHLAQL